MLFIPEENEFEYLLFACFDFLFFLLLLSFGNNGYGELGLGNTVSTSVPSNVIENKDTNLKNVFLAQMGKHYSIYAKEALSKYL